MNQSLVVVGMAFLMSCAGRNAKGPNVEAPLAIEVEDVSPGGLGAIQTHADTGETGKLHLRSVRVNAQQAGDVAEVNVEHVFESEAEVPLEGTFRFPLPDGAIVTGLAMLVNDKMVEGELVPTDKARKVYEEIVDAMQDPAWMEWEHGNTFKIRVFPIEPKKTKTVTMRYLAPLARKGGKLTFVQGTQSIDDFDAIPSLSIAWNKTEVFSEKNVARGRSLPFAAGESPAALREETQDAIYTAVRLTPDWSKVEASHGDAPKNWIVVVDTSRSSLESRKLEEDALRTILSNLPTESRFITAVSDLSTRAQKEFALVTKESVEGAATFVSETEPDGATDIGSMIESVAELATRQNDTAIVYIGDCEASYGTTEVAKLRKLATDRLSTHPMYPVVVGRSSDPELAKELASATGGRMIRARSPEEVKAFATSLKRPVKRLSDVEIVQVPDTVILPAGRATLDFGEEIVAVMRTAKGKLPPAMLTWQGTAQGKTVRSEIAVTPTRSENVARRFGFRWVDELQRLGKPKEEIVQASLGFGVMSKHTSFLVLENEEAYAAHNIARVTPARVTGLDPSAGVNISLDRVQPGDPEIVIDAPMDSERVMVVFPNGETKQASYDPDANGGRGGWMVRFLVDHGTREGEYEVSAVILHRDGQSEVRKLHYTVDTTPPKLVVSMRQAPARLGKPHGTWEIVVTQDAPKDLQDLRRVEVQAPDGSEVLLTAIRWGEFRGYWTPAGSVTAGTVRIVGFDSALNHSSTTAEIPSR